MTDAAVAGWYPAPDNAALVRYWDGEMWTTSARPAPGQRPNLGFAGPTGGTKGLRNCAELTAQLRDGECIEEGFGSPSKTRHTQWTAATNQRVISLIPKSYFVTAYDTVSFEYELVTSVSMTAIGDEVSITAGRHTIRCSFEGTHARPTYFMFKFVDYVRGRVRANWAPDQLTDLPAPTSSTPASSNSRDGTATSNIARQLAQLGELHRDNVLTDDEFERAKARVLGSGTE